MSTPPATASPAAEPLPVAGTYAQLLTCREDRLLQIGRRLRRAAPELPRVHRLFLQTAAANPDGPGFLRFGRNPFDAGRKSDDHPRD